MAKKLFFTEEFKDIDFSDEPISIVRDLVGLYKISNLGKVICVKTGRKVKAYQNCNNYLCVRLKGRSGKSYSAPVHCLVADAFLENPDREVFTTINHKDEDKTNADVRNLEWCTAKYNDHYSMARRCKLSENDIIDIYQKVRSGIDKKLIADTYSISVATVNKIGKAEGYYSFVIFKWAQEMFMKLVNDGLVSAFNPESGKLIRGIEIQSIDYWTSMFEKIKGYDYLDGAVPYKEKKA